MVDRSKELNDFFIDSYGLFQETTYYALLLENMGGGVVEVTYINELRSVLFHLYGYYHDSSASDPIKFAKEYHGAREHLYRAYYDLFSLICSTAINNINKYSQTYSLRIIHQVYPDYFKKVLPELSVITKRLSIIRSGRDSSSAIDEGLSISDKIKSNNIVLTALTNWNDELTSLTNLFIEYQDKENSEKQIAEERVIEIQKEKEFQIARELKTESKTKSKDRLDLILKFVIPFIFLILGFLLNYFFNPNKTIIPSKPLLNTTHIKELKK